MQAKNIRAILLKNYSESASYHILKGIRKPSYENILRMYEEHNIPFEAWRDIKSFINSKENDKPQKKQPLPYEYITEQQKLLRTVSDAENALISLAYEIARLKSGVSIDKNIASFIAQLQPLLSQHRYSVLAPNIPALEKIDDYTHPFCKNFRKSHKEKVASCGVGK